MTSFSPLDRTAIDPITGLHREDLFGIAAARRELGLPDLTPEIPESLEIRTRRRQRAFARANVLVREIARA